MTTKWVESKPRASEREKPENDGRSVKSWWEVGAGDVVLKGGGGFGKGN